MTKAALYDVLKRFRDIGCNLMKFPKLPGVVFSAKLTYRERFELLKKVKDPSYVIQITGKAQRKRKHNFA